MLDNQYFTVDWTLCIKCGQCIEACPAGIIYQSILNEAPPIMVMNGKPHCIKLCQECMDVCPTAAITFTNQIEQVNESSTKVEKITKIKKNKRANVNDSYQAVNPNLGILIKEYDLEAIRNSQIRYHAELVRWFSELLANLDEFSRDHAPLLAEAQTLIANLQDTLDEDDEPLLTERAAYLARHLDFGLESLQADLVAFKNEVTTGRDALASARTLAELRQLEKQERPDFRLVAEHSVELIKHRLQGIDWFREHKELARTLIDLHEAWRTDLHTFEHTTRTLFLEKCADESIAAEKGEEWFAEWQKERMQLEEHLLPLMRAGIERVIPVEVVIAAVELLKTAIRDQLGRFFYDERIRLHQKFAFEPGGELQEKFEKKSDLAEINTAFQKQLEELIFKINGTEGRLFLVRWAKTWYDSLVGELLAFVEQDHLHEQIARETLDGFRALKRHTFEAFLQDVKVYAEARDEKDKEWNSLLFRMRSDLAKKTGKGKQGKNHD